MFNHLRTLLLNQNAEGDPQLPGEELVPAGYRPLVLPTYLQTVRSRLFGADPDRLMLNYRAKQFMTLLHSTELKQFVLALDPRITYDAPEDGVFVPARFFQPQVQQLDGVGQIVLKIVGSPLAPDAYGKLYYAYEVTVSDTVVQVMQNRPIYRVQQAGLNLGAGLYGLSGTGYRFGLSNLQQLTLNNDDGSYIELEDGTPLTQEQPACTLNCGAWSIAIYLQPQWDLGQIAASLESIGEPALLQLFGVSAVEPWLTWKNLWYNHKELPYRLGGLLLAVAYRTEEIRNVQS